MNLKNHRTRRPSIQTLLSFSRQPSACWASARAYRATAASIFASASACFQAGEKRSSPTSQTPSAPSRTARKPATRRNRSAEHSGSHATRFRIFTPRRCHWRRMCSAGTSSTTQTSAEAACLSQSSRMSPESSVGFRPSEFSGERKKRSFATAVDVNATAKTAICNECFIIITHPCYR